MSHVLHLCLYILIGGDAAPDAAAVERRDEYIKAVTRGAGFLAWQDHTLSDAEREFRQALEQRKDEMLAAGLTLSHPILLTEAELERGRRMIREAAWAKTWFMGHKKRADFLLEQDEDYVARMIPELTPGVGYGFTCPNCVGRLSQEGTGSSLAAWSPEDPDLLRCTRCGQVYPDPKYPETARLVCPRTGQAFTYYLNPGEQAHPEDRSGTHAYHWVGHPMHVSFSGLICARKVNSMIDSLASLAYVHQITAEPAYAKKAVEILARLAHCYRRWLYHDYWGGIADCDPMFAAWHDSALPLEFKRHLCESAFKGDTLDRARMLQSYWGAGRLHPSTDSVSRLPAICLAYDLAYDARDEAGQPLWTPELRRQVEGDLILEWVIGAEPYLGGRNQANRRDNKSPRLYYAQAAVAKCLGIAELADTALRGYEAVCSQSFAFDGFSHESPAYTNMYLGTLLGVPETLHGFRWPESFETRRGVVDLYATDERLRLMYRSVVDQLQPNGAYVPLEDTNIRARPSQHIGELGLHRYPEYYRSTFPLMYPHYSPSEYALFRLDPDELPGAADAVLPEILYPVWKTAFLRHGVGPQATVLVLNASPPGGHRHYDNLSLFYADRGQTMLGDLGYVGDMPVNGWIKSAFSHNLVVVDDAEQRFKERCPAFHLMAATPVVSVAEASSDAYAQCTEYRRMVALVKGPGAATFAIDIFRVKGGAKHAYRVSSDLATSDAADPALAFTGIDMPELPPFPDVGASLRREDIFGLRDTQAATAPPAWQACWRQAGRHYRLWMLNPVQRVEASNGPAQRGREDCGRRAWYVDAVREGAELASTFVAIHEPSGSGGTMPIQAARLLEVPAPAGPDAVALDIDTMWGRYHVFSAFEVEAEIDGVRFQGDFGLLCSSPEGSTWAVGVGAQTLETGDFGFAGAPACWQGAVTEHTANVIRMSAPRPANWPALDPRCQAYVTVTTDKAETCFPVLQTDAQSITTGRFPLPELAHGILPALHYIEAPRRLPPSIPLLSVPFVPFVPFVPCVLSRLR